MRFSEGIVNVFLFAEGLAIVTGKAFHPRFMFSDDFWEVRRLFSDVFHQTVKVFMFFMFPHDSGEV